jgi:methionyl aminopeptidase
MDVTRAALESAIAATVAGNRLGDIGAAAERPVLAARFGVVREYVGHGIGTAMHEEPDVPNYGPGGRGLKLREGIVLAIEPMVTAGRATTRTLDDGWTVVTVDGSRAAHFEHTVAITESEPKILTSLSS